MKIIVHRFLENLPLSDEDLETFRWYVYQWTRAMSLKPPDYEKILQMPQQALRDYIPHVLVRHYNIDPL